MKSRRGGRGGRCGKGHGRQVVLPLLPLLLACELTEVTVPPGQRMVVVQAVINRTTARQYVVVEYSETGDIRGQLPFGEKGIPPGVPRIPIRGADVTIQHEGRAACAGRVDTLREQPFGIGVFIEDGVYSGSLCSLEPRDHLLLRVETPSGEVVTGATTVPGAARQAVTAGGVTAEAGGAPLLVNREADTLEIGVSGGSGRALQVEARRAEDLNHLTIFAITDSMGIRFPGNLVNPLEGDSGETFFGAGRYYQLAVALTDTNYYDFVRSFNNPLTGRGFINHLTGGIGVFGSVEPAQYRLKVVAPMRDPREGVYHLTGRVDTAQVDVTMELYLDALYPVRYSAFVQGVWWSGPLDLSADGFLPPSPAGEMRLSFSFGPEGAGAVAYFSLSGVRQVAGVSFPVIVNTYFPDQRASVVDTLTALQISGPSASGRR